ncbi:hypothetical protein GA0061098_10517 [Bradyrhizobium shewense]|uniref:Uncharacterized protein n=1 Tax=Bradyrhizobium shewense TaxID=1761772 RepID=A0A1C3XTX6_9BRAD|nr:hypothetical protein GA0061098_10517 [Bradyrhizobium shewense]
MPVFALTLIEKRWACGRVTRLTRLYRKLRFLLLSIRCQVSLVLSNRLAAV